MRVSICFLPAFESRWPLGIGGLVASLVGPQLLSWEVFAKLLLQEGVVANVLCSAKRYSGDGHR